MKVGPGGEFLNGDVPVSLYYSPTNYSVSGLAGQDNIKIQGQPGTLDAYCVDIFDFLSLPAKVSLGLLSDTLKDSVKVSQINALLSNGDPLVNGQTSSAALQFAIWSVEYSVGDSGYNVTKGALTISADGAALTAANADLAKVLDGTWAPDPNATVRDLFANGNQTLAFLDTDPSTRVPEPSSLAILGLGMAAFGLTRRPRIAA